MKILNLIQGSDEWIAVRARHNTASEASVMMGASKSVTRNELLRMKATGTEREFSEWFQKHILDKGHEVEALARPIAEGIIGENLFPVTATDDAGELLSSYDGITMFEDTTWECKQWNEEKAAIVREGRVPEADYWQVVQQLVVSGASKCLYMVTDGTREGSVWCWKSLEADDEKRLRAGWKQFDEDRANYKHVEEAPVVVGRAPETLPALHIEVTGMVTASNLTAFKEHALVVFSGIKTELKTDEDFANAEKTVKWCGDVEERLEAAKQHALSQTASIDELFRAIDAIKAEARAKRLELDKLVKARKDSIRVEILSAGQKALAEHVANLNQRLGRPFMPNVPADFAGVMKGLKTISSLRNAVDTELARAKIAASEIADQIETNLKALVVDGKDWTFLFPDLGMVCTKQTDDFAAVAGLRVREHQAAEEKRLEAEREKIRQEEQAKAEAAARAQREAEEAAARAQQQEAERAAQQQAAQVIESAKLPPTPSPAVTGSPANIAEIAPQAQADTGATMKLGEISQRLGFTVTADFLSALGFQPAKTDKAAKLYKASAFPAICAAIVRHVQAVAAAPVQMAA